MKPTLTLTIHCCRFPRLFRKPVRSSWCLQSSVNQHVLKKLIRTKFEVMTAAFQGSSEKIHVVWYEYLSRNILFVTKLYNALSTARIQDVSITPPSSHTENSTLIRYPNHRRRNRRKGEGGLRPPPLRLFFCKVRPNLEGSAPLFRGIE